MLISKFDTVNIEKIEDFESNLQICLPDILLHRKINNS